MLLWKKVKVAQLHPTLCDPMDYIVHGILQARVLEWVTLPFSRGSSQLRDQTQVSLHCRRILYQLSHTGSPRILEWVAYPFSSGSSQPRNRTGVSCIAGRFFTNWAIRDTPIAISLFWAEVSWDKADTGWALCPSSICLKADLRPSCAGVPRPLYQKRGITKESKHWDESA